MCNTDCFSTATTVRRTRLCLTLYVHLLSCFFQKGKETQNNPTLICRLDPKHTNVKIRTFSLFPYFKAQTFEIVTATNLLSPLTDVVRQLFISATRKVTKINTQDTSCIHTCQKMNSRFQSVFCTSG